MRNQIKQISPIFAAALVFIEICAFCAFGLGASPAFAQKSTSGPQVTFEPLFGFERTQRLAPTAETVSRFFYGARVLYGYKILAAEGEYTRATDSKINSSSGANETRTDDRLKVGARSTYSVTSLFNWYLRLGVQGTRGTLDSTTSGVTTTSQSKMVYDPYAGTGLVLNLASNFALNAGVTVVFNDFPNSFDKNDYQTSMAFTLRYP